MTKQFSDDYITVVTTVTATKLYKKILDIKQNLIAAQLSAEPNRTVEISKVVSELDKLAGDLE